MSQPPDPTAMGPTSDSALEGRTVCFTGAMCASIDGERATRERATQIAQEHGMIVVKGVTKKLDMLVLADPDSMSGKAKKARQYGTRLVAEPVFSEHGRRPDRRIVRPLLRSNRELLLQRRRM